MQALQSVLTRPNKRRESFMPSDEKCNDRHVADRLLRRSGSHFLVGMFQASIRKKEIVTRAEV